MNRLSMVGFSHHRAPLSLLERVSVPRGERTQLLTTLREAGYAEAVVLSTCSRTEIYAGADSAGAAGQHSLVSVVAARAGLSTDEVQAAAEVRTGHAVVEHLFRVTAGLESRVIGEVEIHGQVRSAFREAHAAGMTGSLLGQLFPAALRCGLRVRTETTLGAQGRSLGHQAVDLGLAMLGDVTDPVIMVVGSGRMALSAVEHLTGSGRRPLVAARNEVRAGRLAGAELVCPLPALAAGVAQADLLICATSAAHDVVTLEHVAAAMATRVRPLTIVDLSVPRNVDTTVAGVPGVRLVDLEDLDDDLTADPALAAALDAGAALVAAETRHYLYGLSARRAGPLIAELRRRVEESCLDELTSTAPPTRDHSDLARAARTVAGRKLHLPIMRARAAAAIGDTDALLRLCELFGVPIPVPLLPDPAI